MGTASDSVPAPPTPPSEPPKRKRTIPLTWGIVGMVISLLVGVSIGATGDEEEQGPPVATPQGEATPEEETDPVGTPSPEEPSPTEAPEVDGTWTLTACDLQLFTQGTDTSTLVGAVEVENTGNVPATVTISIRWDAIPGPLIDGGEKDVTLDPERTREIRFQENIDSDDVSRVQSSPGYESANDAKFCKVRASIKEA